MNFIMQILSQVLTNKMGSEDAVHDFIDQHLPEANRAPELTERLSKMSSTDVENLHRAMSVEFGIVSPEEAKTSLGFSSTPTRLELQEQAAEGMRIGLGGEQQSIDYLCENVTDPPQNGTLLQRIQALNKPQLQELEMALELRLILGY
jgi:hypothetical protein